MTTTEFSLEFDILYNNIMSDTAPGLNTYEKSVFLTKAQEELIKNYFNPKGNKYLEGFDGSAKRQTDFSNLITVEPLSAETGTMIKQHEDSSAVFKIPEKLMLFIQEYLKVETGNTTRVLQVIPLRHDEYMRLMMRPFHYPPRNQAWRILGNSQNSETEVERYVEVVYHLGETLPSNSYVITYVRKPNPIIIEDLVGGVSIDGVIEQSECELNEEIHREILQRAVELAKAAYSNDITATFQVGQRSE